MEPSLLINLRNIKVLGKDNIVFENEEKMYFPKTKHDRIEAKWREYLESLIYKFNGGPVGVETIASSIGEEVSTLEDVVEPYLMQEGFLKRTPRGRMATDKSYNHIKGGLL